MTKMGVHARVAGMANLRDRVYKVVWWGPWGTASKQRGRVQAIVRDRLFNRARRTWQRFQ